MMRRKQQRGKVQPTDELGQAPPKVPLTVVGEKAITMFHSMGWHETVQWPLGSTVAAIMTRLRRSFSAEFKLKAVCLVLDQSYSIPETSRTLDVG